MFLRSKEIDVIIEKDKTVTFEYSLIDEKGVEIDSSEKSGPFTYVHGYSETLTGMEEILDGKEEGFIFDGVIPCEKAYGRRSDENLVPVPREEFEDCSNFEVGMFLNIVNSYDEPQEMEIVAIDKENITIDANGPYADMDIKFSCKVLEVRDATEDEIKEASEIHTHECGCGCGDH